MTRTWQDNAAEFAALDQGEGWPFARLVACSVQKGNNTGGDRRSITSQSGRETEKVSATEFAHRVTQAGGRCSNNRVLRYLEAWGRAAERGWVTPANELEPSMAHQLTDPEQPWGDVYDAREMKAEPEVVATDPPHVWTVLVEARTLVRDLEALVEHCAGVPFTGEVRTALRETHRRLTSGLELLGTAIDSEGISDAALQAWVQEGSA